jgi:hypothetical protein
VSTLTLALTKYQDSDRNIDAEENPLLMRCARIGSPQTFSFKRKL